MKFLSAFLVLFVAASTATDEQDMQDKTVLCLGCTRGIGEAAARQLADRGANVVVTGRSVDAGTAIANDIGGTFVKCDMAERSSLEGAFEATSKHYGGVDAVFANGGTEGNYNALHEVPLDSINKIGHINGMATLHVYDLSIRAFMERGGGSLVYTSSIAAMVPEGLSANIPSSGFVYYTGTKAIAPAMTRSSAMLPSTHNIRINTITPAVYDTKMVRDAITSHFSKLVGADSPQKFAAFNPVFPMCVGDPADSAAVAVAMLANATEWPPSAVVATDGPFSFESNVLTDRLGRGEGWGNIDPSLLRDAKGVPANLSKEDIEARIAKCVAEMEDEAKTEL